MPSKIKMNVKKVNKEKALKLLWNGIPTLILLLIFYIAFKIRAIPLKSMQYLQALDPYQVSRMSFQIVKNGFVPIADYLRSFPYTAPTPFGVFSGASAIPAYLFKFFNFLTNIDFLSWAQIYPALMGALMVVAMYFIGKESFNKWVGLSSSFFLATSAAILQRSSAGWFEKEAIAGVLMLFSIYFIIRAWKRKSWISGIFSGILLGLSMTSWGGTQSLFLLYPLTAVVVLLFNEDIENLLIAFTPTLLLGSFLAFILNSGSFHIPGSLFLASFGTLILIWIRYLAEKYQWISKKKLPYLVPGILVFGCFVLLLAPVFSQSLAHYTTSLINKALQGGRATGIVGRTVAENNPASATQIVSQLGNFGAKRSLSPFFAGISEYFSGWTLSLIGLSIISSLILIMFYKKYKKKAKIGARKLYLLTFIISVVVLIILMTIIPGINARNFGMIFKPYIVIIILGVVILSIFNSERSEREIHLRWYYILLFFWMVSALYGSSQRARIIFLTAQPVAFFAGYGFVKILTEIKHSELISKTGEYITKRFSSIKQNKAKLGTFLILLALILTPAIRINMANATNMAKGIGGSPNPLWMQNLEFIKDKTPIDSVILSWWDYGYWFESIGARAAVVDGGNPAHYVNKGEEMLNFYVADFFTDTNYTKWLPRFKKRGITHLVLDYTMIGKYSAVSQIHNRNNSKYTVLQSFDFNNQVQEGGKTYLSYCLKRGNSCAFNSPKIFIPVKIFNKSLMVTDAPIFKDIQGNTAHFKRFCSPNGVMEFQINGTSVPGCLHFDPYMGIRGLIYVPEDSVYANLVKLYLRDGNEMPEFEKVFDNGFVKMWKINYPKTLNQT